jgi:hypothetical protein
MIDLTSIDWTSIAVLFITAALLIALTLWKRRSPTQLRDIPALASLQRALGLSVEDGSRLHISIGFGSLLTPRGSSALAALAMLRQLAERTSASDRPPVASTGNPVLSLLAQDTLQAGYTAAGAAELFVPTTGRLTGMSPFGYAAGAMPIIRDENVSANVLLGHFGPEAALLTDAAEQENVITIGASDDLTAQSILFAGSQEALIGEELYASGAYLGAGASHMASLTIQDVMRWLIMVTLLLGALAKFMGLI